MSSAVNLSPPHQRTAVVFGRDRTRSAPKAQGTRNPTIPAHKWFPLSQSVRPGSGPYRGDGSRLGATFRHLPIQGRGECLGDFLQHFLSASSDNVPRSQSAVGCGPCPEYSVIDSPSRQGPAFPSREGQGGREPVIDTCAAGGVLGFGSNSPDWQGDMVWHGFPASLCLLGHPFD